MMALIMMALLEKRTLKSEKLRLKEEERSFRCILCCDCCERERDINIE